MKKTDSPIDCVMPAAGLSSRMGQWKLMLPYQGQTILDQSIENALSFCNRVILVAGHRGEELQQRYQHQTDVLVVMNPHYQQGMFGSIQLGVEQVRGAHFFICHGDMPCIGEGIYQQLWQQRGDYTLFPGTTIKGGHPVLLSRVLIDEIVSKPLTGKMKAVINRHDVHYLNMTVPAIYQDVDTPEAYQALLELE